MNKTIKYVVAGAFAVGMTLSSYADITVNWGSQDATPFDTLTGLALPVGDLILVGFATSPGSGLSTLSGTANLAAIGFTQFGLGHIGDGILPAGFGGVSSSGPDTSFSHLQIFIVAFDATTAAGATQMGVWSVDFASNPNWKFPATADVPNSTSIDLDDILAIPGGSLSALANGAHIWYGTGPGAADNGGLRLAIINVPEPSTYVLVATGLLGMIGLIRRRRS
jgi:hypothetical protein